MRRRERTGRLTAVVLGVAVLSSCGASEESAPAPVTVTPPGPNSTYDAEELAVYREAVRRVAAFEARHEAEALEVLSTGTSSIMSFQDNAAEVVLVRCVVMSEDDDPVVQEVVVERYENLTWRIGEFTTTEQPCDG